MSAPLKVHQGEVIGALKSELCIGLPDGGNATVTHDGDGFSPRDLACLAAFFKVQAEEARAYEPEQLT